MRKVIMKEEMAALNEASEMFNETGCVPDNDRQQVPAERMVPEVKEYIDPEIWQRLGNFPDQFDHGRVEICLCQIKILSLDWREARIVGAIFMTRFAGEYLLSQRRKLSPSIIVRSIVLISNSVANRP